MFFTFEFHIFLSCISICDKIALLGSFIASLNWLSRGVNSFGSVVKGMTIIQVTEIGLPMVEVMIFFNVNNALLTNLGPNEKPMVVSWKLARVVDGFDL